MTTERVISVATTTYLKANKVSKSEGTRKVEHAYMGADLCSTLGGGQVGMTCVWGIGTWGCLTTGKFGYFT